MCFIGINKKKTFLFLSRKNIILTVLILIVSINSVFAEEIVKVDMETAINIALSKNIMYQVKKKDLEIAEKNIKIANRLKNPQLFSHTLIGRVTRSNNSQLGINLPVEVL